MYAAAFFESDARKVVEQGLRSIPAQSAYGRIVRDVLDWSAAHPEDWTKTWQLIQDKWDKDDACPDGAQHAFNIDAKLNGAYVALGILYGRGDFARTLEVSTRAGQDSDCNPSSAAGIVGVMLGYERIPEVWKAGIPALADKKFSYTRYSFNEIVASTLTRALKVVTAAGGTVTATEVVVPAQEPQAAPLERWDPGVPGPGRGRGRRGQWTSGDGRSPTAPRRRRGPRPPSPSRGPGSPSSGARHRRAAGPTSTSTVRRWARSTPGSRNAPTTTTCGTSPVSPGAGTRFGW
jgi:hypothetical protein